MFYSSCPGIKAVKKTLDFWNGLILCSSSMLSRQNIFYLYYYLLIFVNTSLNWAPEPCFVWYCANTTWVTVPAPKTFKMRKFRRPRGWEQSSRATCLRSPKMLVAEAKLELGTPVSYFGPVLQVMQLPGLYTKYSKYGSNKKQTQPLVV